MTISRILLFVTILAFTGKAGAQNIDELLTEATGDQTNYTFATFKSTHIVNGHSIKLMPKGQLDFRVSHRFGTLNTGFHKLWGLDNASTHFSLDYGVNDWLMAGFGRGSYNETYDGSLKFRIFRQCTGAKNMPVSVSYLTSVAMVGYKWTGPGKLNFWNRASFVHQLLIARKFNERFSLELNPTYVHRNLVKTELDPNDLWSMGIGTRFKITNHLSVDFEYYYTVPPSNSLRSQKTYNPLSVGFNLETGGHVFQLFFTNSIQMIAKGFIGETTDNWLDGGIHFGFNVSRVFTIVSNNK